MSHTQKLVGTPKLGSGGKTQPATTSSRASSSSSFQTDTFNTSSLTDSERKALDTLITRLSGKAGTDAKVNETRIMDIVNRLIGNTLTRQQAIQDTQGLIGQAARQLAESDLAKIGGAAEAGGASQSALAALLGNDARARTAEAVGAQRAKTIAEFVTAGNQSLSSAGTILHQFNATPDKTISELLQALDVAKGSGKFGTNVSSKSGFQFDTSITGPSTIKNRADAFNSLTDFSNFNGLG